MLIVRSRYSLPDSSIINAPERTILCTTNCAGAMGAGVALAVKNRWPEVYREYRKLWRAGLLHYHRLDIIDVGDKEILLFPTKVDWKNPSPLSLIKDNLNNLVEGYESLGISSLALTLLGTLNGGIKDKDYVERLIFDALDPLPIGCTLYK